MKKYIKALIGIAALGLSSAGTYYYSQTRVSAEPEAESAPVTEKHETKALVKTGGGAAKKDEMVYLLADADGTVRRTIVSDCLENPSALSDIKDISALSDIENVKGSEAFTADGDSIDWAAGGNDIYYRGNSSEQAPVGVKVSYYLDGKELSADEIAGKSGRVTIRFDYFNNTSNKVTINGKEENVVTPFMMATGLVLDNEKFTNIEVKNGKSASDGGKTTVFGAGFPGLKKSLGISDDTDIEIPDYVEITADTSDFSLAATVTIATNQIFSELTADGDLDISELTDALGKLSDASGELVEGSGDLSEGADKLLDGSNEFGSGLHKLTDGVKELHDKSGALTDGISQLSEGAGGLRDGLSSLCDGSEQLSGGISQVTDGLGSSLEGIASAKTGADGLREGADSLKAGAQSLKEGTGKLTAGTDQLSDGAAKLDSGIESEGKGLDSLAAGIDSTRSSLEKTIAANEQILDGLKAMYAATKSEDVKTMIDSLSATIEYQRQIAASMADGNGGIKDGVTKLSEGNKQLSGGIDGLSAGIDSLSDGAQGLDAGIDQLSGGIDKLSAGAGSLSEGIGSLDAGTRRLYEGSKKTGEAAASVYGGAAKLYDGSVQLCGGIDSLNDGGTELSAGVNRLYEGSEELLTGWDTFSSGIDELDEGAHKLSDGMSEFDEDGVQKLKDTLDDDISGLADRFNAMTEASRNYRSFSGIADGMDGSVTFIIRTETVGE